MPAILKTIEDSTIVGMANNARFVKEFPFLKKALVAKKSHCSKCARKAGNKAANMQKVKQEKILPKVMVLQRVANSSESIRMFVFFYNLVMYRRACGNSDNKIDCRAW